MSTLAGVRVLEIAEGVAAPVAGMLLADHGAEVLKIERPEGDFARNDPGFAVWNRGKRSATIDVRDAEDRAWLAGQVAGADICLLGQGQDFSDWGEEVAAAARANGALVTTRFPAWLKKQTPWAGNRESHGLLAAYGGLGWRQSSNDGGPVDPVSYFIAYVHALWGAACTLAALFERGSDGYGQDVTVSGVNALMEALIHPYSVDPHAPDPPTNIGSFGRHPTYRPYQAGDGQWIGSGALGPKFEVALLNLLGIPDVLTDPRIDGDVEKMKNPAHLDWVMERVATAFKQRPRDEWMRLMGAAGIPCGEVRPREELLDHPQVVAIGMRVEVDDPERGRVVMPGVPINLTKSPGRVAGPAPQRAQPSRIAAWAKKAAPSRTRAFSAGPLSGLNVLNLGTFVATPYAGLLLSELGANVIKVEPPAGDPFRNNGFPHNRGMRSLSIDLTKAAGVEAFKRVAATADIVIDGMRPGVVKKMGIDHDALAEKKPDIITLSLSGFGEKGPLAHLPGFDMVMQGFAGIMLAQGDASEPVASTVAYIDVTTACMNVLACMLALVHRRRTGEGQHAWTALVATGAFLQLSELTTFHGRPAPRQGSPDFRGAAWFDRYYAANDGWIRIDASHNAETLQSLKALTGAPTGADAALQIAIEKEVATRSADAAVAWLSHSNIPAVRTRRVSELFGDADLMMSEFAHFHRSVTGALMSMPGRYALFGRTQRWGPLRPPGLGEHSTPILREAKFSDEEIAALVEAKVVREGGPMPMRFGATYR